MERLKDGDFEPASLEAEASDLLRGSGAYGVPASLKRNVRVRLVEAAPLRRRAPLWLRAGLVAGVLGAVAIAMAAVGHFAQKSAGGALSAKPLVRVGVGESRPGAVLGVAGNVPAPSSEEVSAPSPSPSPSPSAGASLVKRGAADAHVDTRRDSAHDSAPVSEASLVYETARALRNEGDPARAARVLEDYFKRYPHGALAEEAQALAIDIAVARGDARAKSLATRYLSSYPNGHFRAKAEHVLDAD
jgi:TolA-binding protein